MDDPLAMWAGDVTTYPREPRGDSRDVTSYGAER